LIGEAGFYFRELLIPKFFPNNSTWEVIRIIFLIPR